MYKKYLIKILFLIYLATLTQAKDACSTLLKYFGPEPEDYIVVASLMKMEKLIISDKDFDLIFSHTTIDTLHQINGRLNKLNDLKDLTIHSYKGHIEKGILSGLNKLERLNIQYTYLSNDNMKEIIALPNLKELYFYNPEFESDFS
ncbi:hypothetical protein BCR32DRAFT_281512 [Anaeromyces robustus]|uniref:RNI-like protein n=1 Tax=Anaeromyces robustus TaxID=1754192 RepID=A0A1Y1X0W9_9FUNG|nr:hypothetical protein BCR32DRAFT_281512 [Anaeromyces robustus]|eukprot:ORX79342.1 hypothetical protein BCR32DRAFT_281512 [Anaeromyces robustus]